ncbi:MAG: DUF721 domain-containing protein [Desulfobulbaceae bacterium]|nr:MAG: DUF721 domain-containing protein [Desulfobulbaceae bacterium]
MPSLACGSVFFCVSCQMGLEEVKRRKAMPCVMMRKAKKTLPKGVRKINTTVPTVLKDKGWEQKFDQHRVFVEWENLVDADFASHARPLKVVKNVLWLEVENSAWMQQFQFQKMVLLDSLNKFLKISHFSDIKFVLGDFSPKDKQTKEPKISFIRPPEDEVAAFTNQVSSIADERVRESLIRLWYLSRACQLEDSDNPR